MNKKNVIGLVLFTAVMSGAPLVSQADEFFPGEESGGQLCIYVLTYAQDPLSGEVIEFATPCDVPEGWVVVPNPNDSSSEF